jgi:anti-sigma B factor antagonist
MGNSLVTGETQDGVVVLKVSGDHIDATNSKRFKDEVVPLIEEADKVVLDLTGVNFIDSAGLGALLSVMRNLTERDGEFRVCSVSRAIKVLFELVRLHKVLDIHLTLEEALSAFRET